MSRKKIVQMVAGLVLVLVLGIGSWWRAQYITHPACSGHTMGTSYSIKISGKIEKSVLQPLTQRIESELDAINRQMSTWDDQSEISRFNHSRSTNAFPCSEAFSRVVQRALELSDSTKGAFDPTLQPLLNLWGFGSEGDEQTIPSDADIEDTRKITGWQKIIITPSGVLQKTEPELSLALGAIAKGYGVDTLARILNEAGLENWFAEIGGEVIVKGTNPDGVPWKIGIQRPTTNPMEEGQLQGIVNLTSGAVATSGDYRNYIIENEVLYSHILDPRSGRAVRSDTAGVTVTADSCMDADGIATALFVMGPEEGLAWVEQKNGVEALFLMRGTDGEIIEEFSSGFIESTGYIPNR
jgi:thiamine biosynthesis lipoprotein